MNHPQSAKEGALRMEFKEVRRRSPVKARLFKQAASRARRQHGKAVIAEQLEDDDQLQWEIVR